MVSSKDYVWSLQNLAWVKRVWVPEPVFSIHLYRVNGAAVGRSMSVSFYDNNAQQYYDDTAQIDMGQLHTVFLSLLPKEGRILDAGCGSGRDTQAFLERGYRVKAFDASKNLAALAERRIGQPVLVCEFLQFQDSEPFDGIWACASLLHTPLAELPKTISQLARFLKPEGCIYASFKYGRGERLAGGRHYTDLDERGVIDVLSHSALTIHSCWLTKGLKSDRQSDQWLNVILRRRHFQTIYGREKC